MRKITVDSSVKYCPKKEHTREKDINPNTKKNNSNLKKQKKMFHKTIKISLKTQQLGDLDNLK